jgi:hypothetical protein
VSAGRLIFLCDWLPPDFGAVGQYSLQHARELAAGGSAVVLVGLTSGVSSREVEHQGPGGGRLEVVRIPARTYDRANFRQRLAWTLRTNLALLWSARREILAADEILFTGSPPFLVHFLVPLNALLRKRLVYRITDFHPECLMAELGRSPWWLRAFHGWTIALRRQVERFEVLGEDQRRRLHALGIEPGRIDLRRDPAPVVVDPGGPPLPLPEGLRQALDELRPRRGEEPVLLLYSGNFGVAHDHETLLEGYRLHHEQGRGHVLLWLNATGAKADLVERELRAAGLPVFRSRPVPLDQLAALLVTPAAHLITLRDAFVGYVLPSKVYGCAASGRDVVFVGSTESDVDLICRETLPAGAYHRVEAGAPAELAEVLDRLVAG